MNMFFAYGNRVVTAPLEGSILNGVTRNSVISLAEIGFTVEERKIDIDTIMADIRSGKITEAFGSGTAAVITPVGTLCYKEQTSEHRRWRSRHPYPETVRHPDRHTDRASSGRFGWMKKL